MHKIWIHLWTGLLGESQCLIRINNHLLMHRDIYKYNSKYLGYVSGFRFGMRVELGYPIPNHILGTWRYSHENQLFMTVSHFVIKFCVSYWFLHESLYVGLCWVILVMTNFEALGLPLNIIQFFWNFNRVSFSCKWTILRGVTIVFQTFVK